ncbi:MAG: hypothetical protein NC548_13025 [Lachnospiraceae bacterium]|nr:hypothetical protein [Lachnospiraceae bacterium]
MSNFAGWPVGGGVKMDRPCKYRSTVECPAQGNCATCGWNPDVEMKRKHILRTEGVHALEGKKKTT